MALTTGIIFGILAMFGWGISDFLSKGAIDRIGAHRTYFYFESVGTIIMIILFIFFPQFRSLSLLLIVLFLTEAFLSFLGRIFFYKGMEVEKVSIVSPIAACYPIVVLILSFFILNESLSSNQLIAFCLMIIGLVLISIKKNIKLESKKGIYLALLAMIVFGFVVFLFGYLIKATTWVFAIAFSRILSWLIMFNFVKIRKISLKIKKSIIPLVILIGISEIFGDIFFGLGVEISLISLISVISSLYPLIVVILARIFLKEKLSSIQKTGMAAILLGLVLISL